MLRPLHASEPHLRLKFEAWELIGIGDVLVVAGTDEALAPIRDSLGPWIVTDLDETRRQLVEAGSEITREIEPVPTGRDDVRPATPTAPRSEYVEWTPRARRAVHPRAAARGQARLAALKRLR